MNEPQNEPVTPDEIVEFIESQKLPEEKSTGLRLLRRAAETITWNEGQISDILQQVGLALGAEFREEFADGYHLSDLLDHIRGMHQDLEDARQAVTDHQSIIDNLRKAQNVGEAANAKVEPAITVDNEAIAWAKDATKFAHKVQGFALSLEGRAGSIIMSEATEIIERSPVN